MSDKETLPVMASEKDIRAIIAVDINGFPTILSLPKNHRIYWNDRGGIVEEWIDWSIPRKPGIYEVSLDYKDIDYDIPENKDFFEYKLKKIKRLPMPELCNGTNRPRVTKLR